MKRQRVLPIILQGTVFHNKELAGQNMGSAEMADWEKQLLWVLIMTLKCYYILNIVYFTWMESMASYEKEE